MLHVTSWDMAGVKTDVTCYVKLFGVDRVKMDLQRPKAKPVADAICVAVAIGGGSRRNTCFRLLVDSCTKKPLDENAPRIETLMSKAYIKTKWSKTQVLDTWRKEFDQIPCRRGVAIRMALPIRNTHSTVN